MSISQRGRTVPPPNTGIGPDPATTVSTDTMGESGSAGRRGGSGRNEIINPATLIVPMMIPPIVRRLERFVIERPRGWPGWAQGREWVEYLPRSIRRPGHGGPQVEPARVPCGRLRGWTVHRAAFGAHRDSPCSPPRPTHTVGPAGPRRPGLRHAGKPGTRNVPAPARKA